MGTRFPPYASSRVAGYPTNLAMYDLRQMVLPTFPPSVQEDQVARGVAVCGI